MSIESSVFPIADTSFVLLALKDNITAPDEEAMNGL
jgi:hypothetical protein